MAEFAIDSPKDGDIINTSSFDVKGPATSRKARRPDAGKPDTGVTGIQWSDFKVFFIAPSTPTLPEKVLSTAVPTLTGNSWSLSATASTLSSPVIIRAQAKRTETTLFPGDGEKAEVTIGSVDVKVQLDKILPTVSIIVPPESSSQDIPDGGLANLSVIVEAQDNVAVSRVEARIDNGDYKSLVRDANNPKRWASDLDHPVPVSPLPLGKRTLFVRAFDQVDNPGEAHRDFIARDSTAPSIEVLAPEEDAVFLTLNPPFPFTARGTASDKRSGLRPLELTLAGKSYEPPVDINGNWKIDLTLLQYGYYTLRLRATDKDGNPATPVDRQFQLASEFVPGTIEELLSSRSYLHALLTFIRPHVAKPDGSQMDTEALQTAFFQPFGELAQPTAKKIGDQVLNSLHVPLQVAQSYLQDSRSLGPVVAEWNFDDQAGTVIVDSGPYENNGSLGAGAQWGHGPTSGAADFTAVGGATVPHASTSLLLGQDGHDFSVSFWLYLRTGFTQAWRTILVKGSQQERTPGLWMRPDSNRIHFRISTTLEKVGWNEGGNSVGSISLNRWTHVTYVKAGKSLKLYIDGRLDAVAPLAGISVSNTAPLYLGQNPWNAGFDGALDDIRIYSFALPQESVQRLSVDRNSPSRRTVLAIATRAHLQSAYEAVLGGVGTSFVELRLLPTLSPAQRSALAARLGLRGATPAADHLADLLPPTGGLTERWLEDVFGIPGISRNPFQPPVYPPPLLLRWQQQAMLADWSAEGQAPGSEPRPFLDPDVIDALDLVTSDREDPLVKLLATRTLWLDGQRAKIRAAGTGTGGTIDVAMQGVLGAIDLDRLAQREAAGQPIAADLAALRLTVPAFRRLLALRTLARTSALTDAEWDDVADILTAVRKQQQLAQWQTEEAALAIWPSGLRLSYHVHPFVPWRASYADRADWQARVGRRLAQWTALERSLQGAVASAGQQALPILRDGILSGRFGPEVAPAIADQLAERLLVDLSSAGATRVTRIDQAVTTLQGLVNGLRTGRFGGDHPAASWTIPERATNEDGFEEEWKWMGSYGSWRAAMAVFLYPENSLLPDLRSTRSKNSLLPDLRSTRSKEFEKLIQKLRSSPRLSGDAAQNALNDANLQEADEATYFGPMLVGLELQKVAAFGPALSQYRKVYDTSKPAGNRALAQLLKDEINTAPAPVMDDDHWTRTSLDPHVNAAGKNATGKKWGNPYTRFTLATIVQCLLAYADSEYAAGTLDSLSNALGLYLTAKELLDSPELDLVPPTSPLQIFIPNPLFDALRAHVESALRKLRRGLSFAGLPVPADPTRSQDGDDPGSSVLVATAVRPTPYRFKVLLERAKQLSSQAQQFEAQYLAALEKLDVETETLLREGSALELGSATVELQQRRHKEAVDGSELARRQRERASISAGRYDSWIAAGPSTRETAQVAAMWDAKTTRDAIAITDAAAAVNSAAGGARLLEPWTWAVTGVASTLAIQRGIAQGFLNGFETRAQVDGILAAQERRQQEWELQRDLAWQDERVGDQQIILAADHEHIAAQELTIANIQARNAQAMVEFLIGKFTSQDFYAWLSGTLASTYAYFLQLAASVAKLAEDQLAFERQQPSAALIKSDYWKELPQGQTAAAPGSPDRRGITSSARLLQDLASVDQLAFESERRLLNLTQTFSLARLAPFEFQQFKQTGALSFATPAAAFDEGFPGHYLRRIKRVRVSVVALIPPSIGIRATLSASGISRLVAGPPTFGSIIVRQDPQWVALTSPMNASGVFELDEQSELSLPFEGMGVDTSWTFELPPAGNPFDFDSLADVLVTIEYTALNSVELRDRVTQRLSPQRSGDLAWSVRRDLPDAWYDLNNPTDLAAPLQIPLVVSRRDFPPQLQGLSVEQIVLAVQPSRSYKQDVSMVVTPSFVGDAGQAVKGVGVPMYRNRISTRGSAAAAWGNLLGAATISGRWMFTLGNDPASPGDKLVDRLRAGDIDDILVIFTFSGTRPPW